MDTLLLNDSNEEALAKLVAAAVAPAEKNGCQQGLQLIISTSTSDHADVISLQCRAAFPVRPPPLFYGTALKELRYMYSVPEGR